MNAYVLSLCALVCILQVVEINSELCSCKDVYKCLKEEFPKDEKEEMRSNVQEGKEDWKEVKKDRNKCIKKCAKQQDDLKPAMKACRGEKGEKPDFTKEEREKEERKQIRDCMAETLGLCDTTRGDRDFEDRRRKRQTDDGFFGILSGIQHEGFQSCVAENCDTSITFDAREELEELKENALDACRDKLSCEIGEFDRVEELEAKIECGAINSEKAEWLESQKSGKQEKCACLAQELGNAFDSSVCDEL